MSFSGKYSKQGWILGVSYSFHSWNSVYHIQFAFKKRICYISSENGMNRNSPPQSSAGHLPVKPSVITPIAKNNRDA